MFCTAVEYIPRERACEQRVSRFQTSNSSDDTLRSSRLQKCSFNSGELTTSTYTSYISRSVLSTSTPHIATHQSGSMMIKKSNSVSPPLNPFGRTLNNDFFLKKILRCKKPGPAWKSWSMMAWSKILDWGAHVILSGDYRDRLTIFIYSNCNGGLISDVLRYARIEPQVLQVELHPYLAQQPLVDFTKLLGIRITAYSSLGPQVRTLKNDAVYWSTSASSVLLWTRTQGCSSLVDPWYDYLHC